MDEVNCVCGNTYDPGEVEVPDNPTLYWVPSCPECRIKITNIHNTVPHGDLAEDEYNDDSSPVGVYDLSNAKKEWPELIEPGKTHLYTRWAIEAHRNGERLPVCFEAE